MDYFLAVCGGDEEGHGAAYPEIVQHVEAEHVFFNSILEGTDADAEVLADIVLSSSTEPLHLTIQTLLDLAFSAGRRYEAENVRGEKYLVE